MSRYNELMILFFGRLVGIVEEMIFILYIYTHTHTQGRGAGVGKIRPHSVPPHHGGANPHRVGQVGLVGMEWGHFAIPTSFIILAAPLIDDNAPAIINL